jgi:hypothetical protein
MKKKKLTDRAKAFLELAKKSTKRKELLTVALAAESFFNRDRDFKFRDHGNWRSELTKRIDQLSKEHVIIIDQSSKLEAIKYDILTALSSLFRNLITSLDRAPNN